MDRIVRLEADQWGLRYCAISIGDICVSRQGRVLTKNELENPDSVPDQDFCKHRKECKCNITS
jgi:hypothetical protein